jgi:GT2 family glycosyltransferase
MNTPKVAVIMLNWNGYADTIECIESLKKVTYTNFFIIIVDNASSCNDVQILHEKFGNYVDILAQEKNWGFPEGCNIGMRYALTKGADYLLLLNNDTVVDPEFMEELVKTAEGDEKIGIVGSKVYYYYYPTRIQYIGGRINWILGINGTYIKDEEDFGQYDMPMWQDYVPATSCMIKRSVVEKIGYLDPFYFWAIEEFDYCTRAKRAGFKIIYQPKSKIWHKWQASGVKLSDYPETRNMINKMVGAGAYKLWWRLYRTYSPPALFIIPFLLQVSLIGPFCVLFFKRSWRVLLRGIISRFSGKSR